MKEIIIIFHWIIKIIDKRLLLLNNLIIRDSLKSSLIIVIKINKRYYLIKDL